MNYRKYLAKTDVGDEVLADWRWLTGPDLRLWHVTMAGDALLRNPADGSVHFLDTVAAKVELIASGVMEQLTTAIDLPAFATFGARGFSASGAGAFIGSGAHDGGTSAPRSWPNFTTP